MSNNGTAPIEAGLYRKLAEILGEVGYVQKTGVNDFQHYRYVTEADLLQEVRGKLAARNIILIPSVVDIAERTIATAKGKESTITTMRVAFTFCDGDTGAMYRAEWAGAGDDAGDKGIYKAYTGALKYFLMKAFLIPTGDDPEADESADKRASSRTAPAENAPRVPPSVDLLEKAMVDAQAAIGLKLITAKGVALLAVEHGAQDTSSVTAALASMTDEGLTALVAALERLAPEGAAA